ncbi:MAG: hypothetical protein ACOX2O_02855 [Bdellovibrionota bacterium]|jgi:hypothetical protein
MEQNSQVKNRFNEVFDIEMDGMCYGIEKYPGEIFPGLVHALIKELSISLKLAVENYYPFDIIALAKKMSKAAKYLVNEKEITFSILAYLPHPNTLDEDGQFTLAQIIDQVEQTYGGALERLQRKWSASK